MLLKIIDYKLPVLIGVYAHEKEQKTELKISLEIEFNGEKAAISDDVADTLDYDKVAEFLEDIGQQKQYDLLEALARDIKQGLFSRFVLISDVTVSIIKPIIPQADIVSITY